MDYKFYARLQVESEKPIDVVVNATVVEENGIKRLLLDFGSFNISASLKPFRDCVRDNWKSHELKTKSGLRSKY